MVTKNVIIELPGEYQNETPLVYTKHEEDALCWLWAFPFVFPWSKPIAWLYTPVVGNYRWPGDLWGIDADGELLVIEAKQCNRRDDPFADFVCYHRNDRVELSAIHWQWKWRRHFSAELSYPDGQTERPQGKTNGILPRSNRRSHLRSWPALSRCIDQQIRSPQYSATVENYLRNRIRLHDPTPYYIALMIESEYGQPILTEVAIASARSLELLVGPLHVGVVTIHCRRISKNQGQVETRKLTL